MKKKIASLISRSKEMIFFKNLATKYGKKLRLVQNNILKIEKNHIILVSVMKNEAHRLPYFLKYYRELGVDHFLLVDNGSTDDFIDVVKDNDDISTFYTESSYKESNFGMHWVNFLLNKYGRKHWCVTCDPDEFLTYPYMDTRNLKDLTAYLDSLREKSFFTVMVDMYGKGALDKNVYCKGKSPLENCPYFDKSIYSKIYDKRYNNMFIQGGLRQRVFFEHKPQDAPALNKICLVKWEWNYAYVESMHMLIPKYLNSSLYKTKTSGAMLHFKFISQLKEKVEDEMVNKEHWNNSSEYKKYKEAIVNKNNFYHKTISKKYKNWVTLVETGHINIGEW